MKKNKGFTLIELLAVIVVLAIIALIATPIVMNTIKNSKKGAAESSASSYIKQVETAIVENRVQTGNTISDGTYEINSDGNICLNTGCAETLAINMNGNKPSSGTITIKNGQVETASNMIVNGYNVDYTSSNNTYVVTEVFTGILCTAVTELSTQYVYEFSTGKVVQQQIGFLASETGPYAYGVEYSCNLGDEEEKTFYVLEDGDTTTLTEGRIAQSGEVSLIMNMNIDKEGKGTIVGNTVKWCKDGVSDTSCSADGAIEYLKISTKSWNNLIKSQISLPSYEQVKQVVGTETNENSSKLQFLRENLYVSGNPRGYWTSSLDASNNNNVWTGDYMKIGWSWPVDAPIIGVRPVITIPKAQLG